MHSINRFRNEFAVDSNFVMTQLRTQFELSRFFTSLFLFCVHARETGVHRTQLQVTDLNHKMETLIHQKLIREAAYDIRIKEQVDCHKYMLIDWRILASVLAWKSQKALPLGSISERLPIEWAQFIQVTVYLFYSYCYFIYESMDSLQSQEEVKYVKY